MQKIQDGEQLEKTITKKKKKKDGFGYQHDTNMIGPSYWEIKLPEAVA